MIDVNRQYAHLGGKMRGIIHGRLRQAGYAVKPLTAMPFVAPVFRAPPHQPPPMTFLPASDDHQAPIEIPKDCLVRYALPGGRMLLMSVDANGMMFEQVDTPEYMDTPQVEEAMLRRMRESGRPTLRLIKPSV